MQVGEVDAGADGDVAGGEEVRVDKELATDPEHAASDRHNAAAAMAGSRLEPITA